MDARTKATNYLNVKPRTRAQVIKYLTDKGYGSSDILDTVASLEEYKYIDDENYARLYFELGFEKGHGISRIRRELAEKGIERDLIEAVCNELEDQDAVPDQYEAALEIGLAAAAEYGIDPEQDEAGESLDYEQKTRLQSKIARRLAARGFSGETAYRVAKEVIK